MCAVKNRWRCQTLFFFLPQIANWQKRHGQVISSAFKPRTIAHRRHPDRRGTDPCDGHPLIRARTFASLPRGDPMKAKHLEKALMQFAEEGAAKVFKPTFGSGFIVGLWAHCSLKFWQVALNWNTAYPYVLNNPNLPRPAGCRVTNRPKINFPPQTNNTSQRTTMAIWSFLRGYSGTLIGLNGTIQMSI